MDYIKMKVDGFDAITIEWDEVEDGVQLVDFMSKVDLLIKAIYSKEQYDNYMRGE
jgi:hypothetical protein